jgi:hypothetical protein
LIEKLKLFLNGALSFEEASSIFLIVCKNKTLANNIMRGEVNDFKIEKLKYEIGKIVNQHPAALKINTDILSKIEIVPAQSKPTVEYVISSEQNDEAPAEPKTHIYLPSEKPNQTVLGRIESERKELYQLRGHLHGRLHQIDDVTESYEVAKQIIEIQPKIDVLNEELTILKNGGMPSRFLKKTVSAQEFVTAKNLKQYIARDKKKMEQATSPAEKKRYHDLVAKHETKLKSL